MSEKKQYGLILPSKSKGQTVGKRKLCPLKTSDDELEDDNTEETSFNWIEASLKKSVGNSGQQMMQKKLLKEAYKEDSSIFQYDEVYDEIKSGSNAVRHKELFTNVEKKSKYIATIKQHAEKRKLEQERRMEKKVQKEREAEGDLFADKEAFVTPSYLKKMEELKKAEEEAEKERWREELSDVAKHKNFGVFYSHLLKQKVGTHSEIKIEPPTSTSVKENTNDNHETNANSDATSFKKVYDGKKKHYRSRRHYSDSEDENQQSTKIQKCKRSHNSECSDHSNDDCQDKKDNSYHGSQHKVPSSKKIRDQHKSHKECQLMSPKKKRDDKDTSVGKEIKVKDENNEIEDNQDSNSELTSQDKKELGPKLSKEERMVQVKKLFEKRTVKEKFQQALQRYYQRKATREPNRNI